MMFTPFFHGDDNDGAARFRLAAHLLFGMCTGLGTAMLLAAAVLRFQNAAALSLWAVASVFFTIRWINRGRAFAGAAAAVHLLFSVPDILLGIYEWVLRLF